MIFSTPVIGHRPLLTVLLCQTRRRCCVIRVYSADLHRFISLPLPTPGSFPVLTSLMALFRRGKKPATDSTDTSEAKKDKSSWRRPASAFGRSQLPQSHPELLTGS